MTTLKTPFLALILCLGCATSTPTTYEKGAYRPAPAFDPATRAPHTFPPGTPSQAQPRPKPTRVLPQTPETRREPTLWATTPPRGDYNDLTRQPGEPIPDILFFGVALPVPPDAKDAVDTLPIEWCAKEMTRRAHDAILVARIMMLPPEQRRCHVDLWVRVEKMAAETGRKFRDTACAAPGLFSPAVDQLIADFASHDLRLNGRGRMEH